MKAALPFMLIGAAIFIAGCGTPEKKISLADLHPTPPGTAIYNPTNNTTTISNNGNTWYLAGNCTNVMLFTEDTPETLPARIFERLYQVANPTTAMSVTYLGQKDGYAYLRIRSFPVAHPGRWRDRVSYVKLSELDPAFRDALPPNQPSDK